MSKLLMSVLLFGTLVLFSGTAQAENLGWGGIRYNDGATLLSGGYGTDIGGSGPFGGHTWVLTGVNVGFNSSWDIFEVAMIWSPSEKIWFGLLAGPHVDWTTLQSGAAVTYLSGAGGGIAGYDFWSSTSYIKGLGVWGYGKFNYTFEADNLYRDGWQVGGGGYVRF